MHRPSGNNADEWNLWLCYWLQGPAQGDAVPSAYLAVQIAEALDAATARADAAESRSAALARALEEARDELLECKADYHRNPSSVIDKCNAVLAEARSPLASRRTQIHNKKL